MTPLTIDRPGQRDSVYWEPWHPCLGDRVRVQLGECMQDRAGSEEGPLAALPLIPDGQRHVAHADIEQAAVGVVVGVDRDREGGHYYAVWFTPWRYFSGTEGVCLRGVVYAAAELELLKRGVPLPQHHEFWHAKLSYGRAGKNIRLNGSPVTDPEQLAYLRQFIPELGGTR